QCDLEIGGVLFNLIELNSFPHSQPVTDELGSLGSIRYLNVYTIGAVSVDDLRAKVCERPLPRRRRNCAYRLRPAKEADCEFRQCWGNEFVEYLFDLFRALGN